MAKDSMSKLAGILILLSVFLPVRYLTYSNEFINLVKNYELYQWLFGLTYRIETTIVFSSGERSVYTYTFFNFGVEYIPGIIIALVLLIMSVLIISNANGGKGAKVKKKGIISIILLVVDFSWFYYAFIFTGRFEGWGVIIYPYIGFFGILIGGILAIIGGNKMK